MSMSIIHTHLLKQGSTDIAIEGEGKVGVEVLNPLLQIGGSLAISNAHDEELHKPGE